jgi:hypothetical protein
MLRRPPFTPTPLITGLAVQQAIAQPHQRIVECPIQLGHVLYVHVLGVDDDGERNDDVLLRERDLPIDAASLLSQGLR